MSGRGDSKGHMSSFNGLRENVEAMLHRRNKDSASDVVVDDESAIEIDYDILAVEQLEEAVLKIINDATRDMEALFKKVLLAKKR